MSLSSSVIVITGIMASGKSTIAQALAEHLPRSVHLRGDVFRRIIVNGQAVMNDQQLSEEGAFQLRLRQGLAADVARKYAGSGFCVVLQDIYIEDDLAAMVDRLAGNVTYVVVLCPSVETVVERDRARQEERGKFAYKDDGLTPHLMDTMLRHSTPRIGLWLDTSNQSVDQVVAEIVSRLDEARVSP